MSIFKSTLKNFVAAQLKAREKVIGQIDNNGKAGVGSRGSDFLLYTTGKNSWVRMVSFVNYDSYSYSKGSLRKDGNYSGNQLSKKYILEGGTLYQGDKLRSGIGKKSSIYGSDLDLIGNSTKAYRGFGLRPMPGITSVDVTHKNAYGSLREAVVNFIAWDKHQLEELEVLFMRTGYTCLLEWGWSQYLDFDKIKGINDYPEGISLETFRGNTFSENELFNGTFNEDNFYNKIDKNIEKYKGNYDAMLGYVKNFSWQLMPNGGFQCSTTLISRGEVIDTLKASSNPNIILGSVAPQTLTGNENKSIWSSFEKIFINIIAHANDVEFNSGLSIFYQNEIDPATNEKYPGSFYVKNMPDDDRYKIKAESDKIFNDINTRLINGTYKAVTGTWDDIRVVDAQTSDLDLTKNIAVKTIEGGTNQGAGLEYISMNSFIAILTDFFLPKNSKTDRPIVDIVIPNITPCLASPDSVSIDPTTCLIKNTKATFICNNTTGFVPQVYKEISTSLSPSPGNYTTDLPEFIQSGNNIGTIGNIYISISRIVDIYRSLSGGPDGVNVIDLLKEVLDAVSFALGGINDFQLYNDKNTVQIIDVKYFEQANPASKFKFDLIGLKSICRDVKINSRIFSEQSTMIGIGATSGDNVANLGDIYTSTQNYFNRGLKDRIIKSTYANSKDSTSAVVNGIQLTGEQLNYYNIYSMVSGLESFVINNVLGENNIRQGQQFKVSKLPQSNEILNAGSLLKTYHLQINSSDTDFKALIPFELEITLDGIGGLVVGQIFTIDKSVLPKDYHNKNLGFIVTGVNHSLQNNDWITNIKTQVCLLDNDKISERYGVDKNTLKQTITEIRQEATKVGYLLSALADYMVAEVKNMIYTNRNESYKVVQALSDINRKSDFIGNVGSKPSDEQLIKNLFIGGYGVDGYLDAWYKHAKTILGNDPNFPQTYQEFTTTKLGGTEKPFNSSKFDDFILSAYGSTSRSLVNLGEATESDFKSAWKSIFVGQVIDFFNVGLNIGYNNPTTYISPDPGPENNKIDTVLKGNLFGFNTEVKRPLSISSRVYRQATEYTVSTLKVGAFDSMFTLFYNYLLQNLGYLDLIGFEPPPRFDAKKANFEKVIQ